MAALVMILSCSLPVYSVPDWARDRAVIRTLVVDKMSEAWNTGDAALWAMAYLPDSEFMNIFGVLYLDRLGQPPTPCRSFCNGFSRIYVAARVAQLEIHH